MVLSDGSRKYVWGLGLAYSVDNAGAISVFHTDGLGSIRALTDGSGTLVGTYLTDPFGAVLATGGSSTQPFRFTGEQRDDTGLYYLRARFYDPVLGRFLSRDPVFGAIRNPLSLNRYSYVQNNPVNAVDPTGHCMSKITRGDCEWGDDGSDDLAPTNCSDTTNLASLVCGDPDAVAAPPGGPVIRIPIDPISRAAAALAAGLLGDGGRPPQHPGDLTPEQSSNLKRFEKSLPKGAGPTRVYDLPGGGKAFQADVPARNVPGSWATYEKQVAADGRTLRYSKTTYAPDGSIVHVKEKHIGH